MRKIHGQKQAVAWTLAGAVSGAVAGGLVLYGAVWLCRRLAAAPGVQRMVRFIRIVVEQTTTPSPAGSETVFQAEPAIAQQPGWTPHSHRDTNLYGPN
jgi:hypothetical protein